MANKLTDPQDELAIDELDTPPDGIKAPCYAYLTTGFHFENVEKMQARFYRKARAWVSSKKAQKVPAHFLCRHCMTRHACTKDEVNSCVFDYPFSIRKSVSYDDLVNRILAGAQAAGSSSYKYNSFTVNTETDFWNLISKAPKEDVPVEESPQPSKTNTTSGA